MTQHVCSTCHTLLFSINNRIFHATDSVFIYKIDAQLPHSICHYRCLQCGTIDQLPNDTY